MLHLESLPSQAARQKKENIAFFKRLKKRAPKNLGSVTQEIHNEVFEEVDCLSCGNCCRTTGPLFLETDINRIAKHFKMKPRSFMDDYLKLDEDGDFVLKETPCAFLGADNYCSIYEVRPKACREYPHTDHRKITQIAKITVANTAICPAAFKVVERMKEIYSNHK